MKQTILLQLFLCALLISGCNSENAQNADATKDLQSVTLEEQSVTTIPHEDSSNYLSLGNGYNTETGEKKLFPCVEGSEEEAGNVNQQVFATYNLSLEEAMRIAEGKLAVGFDSPILGIGVNSEWANEVASSDLSQSINMTIMYKPKRQVLLPSDLDSGTLGITSKCQTILEARPDLLLSSAGNAFITSINSIASLSVTLKITSATKSDKDLLTGALKFSYYGVRLEGELSDIVEKLDSSTKVSLNIKQLGGDPTALLAFGAVNGENVADCAMATATDADAMSSCISIFNNLVEYANDETSGLKGQLQSADDYAIVSYSSTDYTTSGLDELIPDEGYELVSILRELKLAEMHALYKKSWQNWELAHYLITEKSSVLTSEQYLEIESISEKALANSELAYDLLVYCQDNPYGDYCYDQVTAESENIEEYDEALLSI
ncbi:MAG: hypothetical protein PVI97_10800 [Candidatus Thiodiazotropha sp.]